MENIPAQIKDRLNPNVTIFKDKFRIKNTYDLPGDTLRSLLTINSQDPTIRPLTDNSVSDTDKVDWKKQFVSLFRDGNKPKADRIADRLLKNLERIGQDVFEQELLTSFSWAKSELLPEKIKNAGFVYYNAKEDRSNEWAREILKDSIKHPALNLPTADYYVNKTRTKYDTGVIIDDASYSGQLVTDHIKRGFEVFGMQKFLVIVPFMTDVAKLSAYNMAKQNGVELKIFNSYTMATVEEILGKEDFDFLRQSFAMAALTREHVTTFFAHKVADYRSFLPLFDNTRTAEVENHLKSLVPQKTAVYKKEYFNDLKKSGFKGFK